MLTYMFVMLFLFIGGFVYNAHALDVAQKKNEQDQLKFCDVINTVVNAYKDSPEPTTPLGLTLKAEYIQLQERLGCK